MVSFFLILPTSTSFPFADCYLLMGFCRFILMTSHEQRNHQLLTNPVVNFKQPKRRAEMVFQKRSSSEMESCGGGQVAEMPRVPKSARVRGFLRIDSALASLAALVCQV